MSQLLRWTHPRVLQPALSALKEHLDGGRLAGLATLELENSWACHIDFNRAHPIETTPPAISIKHTFWHTCSLTRWTEPVADGGGAGGSAKDSHRGSLAPSARGGVAPSAATAPAATPLAGGGASAAQPTLRFQVELSLTFTAGSVEELASSDVRVVDLQFEGVSERAMRDEAKACLKAFCLPHLDYVQIWRRPLHRLPVHKDVPRLLKGLVINGPDGSEIYRDDRGARPGDPSSQVGALAQLMCALARALDGESTVRFIEEALPQYLSPETGDVAAGLRHFLLESGLPESALFVQVLKAIHQVRPALAGAIALGGFAESPARCRHRHPPTPHCPHVSACPAHCPDPPGCAPTRRTMPRASLAPRLSATPPQLSWGTPLLLHGLRRR